MIFRFFPPDGRPGGGGGGGALKFIISGLRTLQMLYTKLVKIGPVVLEKKMLIMHDERLIGHLNMYIAHTFFLLSDICWSCSLQMYIHYFPFFSNISFRYFKNFVWNSTSISCKLNISSTHLFTIEISNIDIDIVHNYDIIKSCLCHFTSGICNM